MGKRPESSHSGATGVLNRQAGVSPGRKTPESTTHALPPRAFWEAGGRRRGKEECLSVCQWSGAFASPPGLDLQQVPVQTCQGFPVPLVFVCPARLLTDPRALPSRQPPGGRGAKGANQGTSAVQPVPSGLYRRARRARRARLLGELGEWARDCPTHRSGLHITRLLTREPAAFRQPCHSPACSVRLWS